MPFGWRKARTTLRTGVERLNPARQEMIATITTQNHDIGSAWRLKEQLRDLLRASQRYVGPSR
ncbi:transposase [Mycobacterium sp. AT1]|uniref:transposase n=1 Tax=Mycobacterium sp. AT1 TaxID=1961706 RepID=UPI002101A764|nr:transposase [Mycobacterium sp. AT1]